MEEYINKNYNSKYLKFKKYCNFKYSQLTEYELEDIYQEAIIKVLTSKNNIDNSINNIDGYFWITLLNCAVEYNIKRSKKNSYISNENSLEDFKNIDKYAIKDSEYFEQIDQDKFDILMEKLKSILLQNEYHFLINFTYNKMSYKEIAEQMSYSINNIFKMKKKTFEKIKIEIMNNKNFYLNEKD